MSAMTGIFKFDPRDRIDSSQFAQLISGIDRFGPDGGSEYLGGSIAMGYRAFHTTPESHLESQPLKIDGIVLTWDGRLDNREDLVARLDRPQPGEMPTDIELVAAIYQRWGKPCFSELIGDWALALWDERTKELILARDYIGVRRLFYRSDSDGVVWSTVLEPLVLTAPYQLHLDLNYIAGCFYPRPPIETTPYQEIRALVPGTCRTIHYEGRQYSNHYWRLNPDNRIRYSLDTDYEEHFREVFSLAVRRRLRSDRTILAELSGGIDSSSIVCMADLIRSSTVGPTVETVSYYNPEEPSGDERPFFSAIERERGRPGHHISLAEFKKEMRGGELAPLPLEVFVALPGYFARTMRWSSKMAGAQERVGSRVILSGMGGDELLGGIQYEAPELAEHLRSGKLFSFARSLRDWSTSRRKTVFDLSGDVIQLLRTGFNPSLLGVFGVPLPPWILLGPADPHRELQPFARWRELRPTGILYEWSRYTLGSQLTCTDLPLIGCSEKRYPLLDRSIFEFLAAIPRIQVLKSGNRRSLMRRSLKAIVPHDILFRRSKWFSERGPYVALQSGAIDDMFKDPWQSDGWIISSVLFRKRLEEIRQGTQGEVIQLQMAVGVEQWLRRQADRGIVNFTKDWDSARDSTPPRSRPQGSGSEQRAPNTQERRTDS